MKSFATPKFWLAYARLPQHIQRIAQKQYLLWQSDPRHPSLQFKSIGQLWSVRVTQDYRALALFQEGDYYWIWIGTHAEYDQVLRGK
jgi:hypothetical protein